jgi:hypothetical protein
MSGVTDEHPPAGDGAEPAFTAPGMQVKIGRIERLLGYRLDPAHLPAWLRPTEGEKRLPVVTAILATIALQIFAVPHDIAFRPWWLLPGLELALLVALSIANPIRINPGSKALRACALALVAVASWATAWSAARLVYELVNGRGGDDAPQLLLNGGAVWFTNVIVFALWYWEWDRGGPGARALARKVHPDFLFAQMAAPELADHDWEPNFIDYAYLSFTNATAFSPTDTLPLSRWAKLAMMFQSAVSLVTVALVVARAVNILR